MAGNVYGTGGIGREGIWSLEDPIPLDRASGIITPQAFQQSAVPGNPVSPSIAEGGGAAPIPDFYVPDRTCLEDGPGEVRVFRTPPPEGKKPNLGTSKTVTGKENVDQAIFLKKEWSPPEKYIVWVEGDKLYYRVAAAQDPAPPPKEESKGDSKK